MTTETTLRAGRFLILALILFLLAAMIGAYLTYSHYMILNGEAGFHTFCAISEAVDCDVVNSSRFSEFLGIPLGTWGLGYYLLGVILCAAALTSPFQRRESLIVLLGLSALTVGVTAVTALISLLKLKTVCVFCVALYALNLATFALVLAAWKAAAFPGGLRGEWRQCRKGGVLAFLGAGIAVLAVSHLVLAQLRRPVPFEESMFLTEFRAQPPLNIEVGDSPRMGLEGDTPPLRIVEFADFQCPGCGVAAKKMHHLLNAYGDRVQLVFKNYPLDQSCNPKLTHPMHREACLAARAAVCAHKQGKFKAFYERLFENQHSLSKETFRTWAGELGMDAGGLSLCLDSEEAKLAVRKDLDLGETLGVVSTPTFFLNGRKVEGILDEAHLKTVLREFGLL